jgi:hypothetical protein
MGRLGPIAYDLASKCEVILNISDQQLRSFRPGEVSGAIRRNRFGEISIIVSSNRGPMLSD